MDVDHPGNCIGTIDRRRTVFQDFNSIDNTKGDGIEIDEVTKPAATDGVDPALAIYQHQRAISAAFGGAQVAQIDRADTERRALRAVRVKAHPDAGHGLQDVAGGSGRSSRNILIRESRQRANRRSVFARNPAAGYGNDTAVLRNGVTSVRILRKGRLGKTNRHGQSERRIQLKLQFVHVPASLLRPFDTAQM